MLRIRGIGTMVVGLWLALGCRAKLGATTERQRCQRAWRGEHRKGHRSAEHHQWRQQHRLRKRGAPQQHHRRQQRCCRRLSGQSNTGNANTGTGFFVLQLNATGGGNTAVGGDALALGANDGNNIAVGLLALGSNLRGSSNTVVGGNALESNTTGSNALIASRGSYPELVAKGSGLVEPWSSSKMSV